MRTATITVVWSDNRSYPLVQALEEAKKLAMANHDYIGNVLKEGKEFKYGENEPDYHMSVTIVQDEQKG